MSSVQDRGNNRSDTDHEAAQRMFAAWERWDLETVESLVADSAVDRRPQSGEHFVGRANIMACTTRFRALPRSPGEASGVGRQSGSARELSNTAKGQCISSASWSSPTGR